MTDQSLRRAAAAGAMWSGSVSIVLLLAQVLYTSMTSRLVSPASFSSYALALVVIQFFSYFGNAGLGNAVQRIPRLGFAELRAAVVLAVAYGIAVALAVELSSVGMAHFWHDPGLVVQLRVLAWQPLSATVAAVFAGQMRRSLRFHAASFIDMYSNLLAMSVAVCLLAGGLGPVALAVFPLGAALLAAVGGAVAVRRDLQGSGGVQGLGQLAAMSATTACQNLTHVPVLSAPVWLSGRLVGGSAAALASRGWSLTNLPLSLIMTAVTRVNYPMVLRLRQDRARLGRALEQLLLCLSLVTATLFALIAGEGDLVVRVLLGGQWAAVSSLLPSFALLGVCYSLQWATWSLAEADHQVTMVWRTQLVLCGVAICAVTAASVAHRSVVGVILGVTLGELAAHAYQLWAYRGSLNTGRLLRSYGAHLAFGLGVFAMCKTLVGLVEGQSLAGEVMVGVASGLAAFLAAYALRRFLPGVAVVIEVIRAHPTIARRRENPPSAPVDSRGIG